MAEYRIIIIPCAGVDIEGIYEFISQDSLANAATMTARILDAIDMLKQFPHRMIVKNKSQKSTHPVRALVIRPYIVYFRVLEDESVVRVLHVRHGSRRQPGRFNN